jgi:hypothetical protein
MGMLTAPGSYDSPVSGAHVVTRQASVLFKPLFGGSVTPRHN